ncbi:hypothetical protein J2Y38_000464 [Flavobacterium sp. 2755]|uniref:hypothetical protein n=1 Tax=Flavobacterium sp. 2755 TaxID=2817765 RepID=UPI00285C8B41|nr:hypothetical protein [Flavobacterium sp. 2755]MDR6760285.1 hypothetical protein [Flavobacterium sp. 2755]
MSMIKKGFLLLFCAVLQIVKAQEAPYSIGFIPASIEEGDIAFPIYEKWHLSGQADFQLVTQGAYTNGNPFAYTQRVVFRPWLIYSGFKNIKLWLGYAHNQKYAVEEAGNYETLENRLIVMGTFSQDMPKGSIFEQCVLKPNFLMTETEFHRQFRV